MEGLQWQKFLLLASALACYCSAFSESANHSNPRGDLRGGYRHARGTIQTTSASVNNKVDVLSKRMRQLRRDDELFLNSVTRYPTRKPTKSPTMSPTQFPSISYEPTVHPTTSQIPSISNEPTVNPSISPTTSAEPSSFPSSHPTTSPYPSMSPSKSLAPTSSPSYISITHISAFSLVVYRSSESSSSLSDGIDKKELENILETFVLEQTQSGMPDFQITRSDLVLVALPKQDVEIDEFILSGDLVCIQSECPSTNETDAFVLQALSNEDDKLLMLLNEANDPSLQSARAVEISMFNPSKNENIVVAEALYAKVANDDNDRGERNSPILIGFLVGASMCLGLVLVAIVGVKLYRKRGQLPREISFDAISEPTVERSIVSIGSKSNSDVESPLQHYIN